MKRIKFYLSSLLLLLVLEVAPFAQVPNDASAKVAGRINIKGQPAQGVQVLLSKTDSLDRASVSLQSPAFSTTTNTEGRYQIANLTAGAYRVSVYAPAHVIDGENPLSYEYGKTVNIAEGDQIENLDFSLVPGGVITGKVTDEYNKPVIAEGVQAFRLDQHGKRDNAAAVQMLRWQTDDRGVYRIFGLEPGRYVVGVGASSEDPLQPIGSRGAYKRTYHPGAVDEADAKIVEVQAGAEVENVDIKLIRSAKTYTASGRVIDSDTGKPLPGVTIGCEFALTAGSTFRMGDTITNSNGEFRLKDLTPNTYTTYVFSPGENEFYSDRVNFEIANDDVAGLEIKMFRGATISGVAEVEGTRDSNILARLSRVPLRAEATSQDTTMMMLQLMQGGGMGNINPNGTLRISGVRPGRTRIVVLPPPDLKGFTLARVERNGVEMRDFDVKRGEQITGVRLVFTYGTSILAGRVEVKGGTLPSNTQMTVRLVREGVSADDWWLAKQANVDARGQFAIEGVSQGNYIAYLMIFTNDGGASLPRIEQSVSIPANMRREITLVLDLTNKDDE
ncbi:MAG TPA: carboxypeptidase regulatory-like domain-containing protein [Pyrinomonadaceae bacterium]|nr:carboxypeptidase regulatory-like domain-containing protein [Pyrinomonadaceae bacterium]